MTSKKQNYNNYESSFFNLFKNAAFESSEKKVPYLFLIKNIDEILTDFSQES